MGQDASGFNPNLIAGFAMTNQTSPATMTEALRRFGAGEACFAHSSIDRVFDWLLREGRLESRFDEFVAGFARQLVAGGFPLKRLFVGVRTLHPQIAAIAYYWKRGDETVTIAPRDYSILNSAAFSDSPIKRIYVDGELEIRRRLVGPDAVFDFPILTEMREAGATDYAVFGLKLSGGAMSSVSITTDAEAGFAEGELADFRALLPLLAVVVEAKENARLARSLLQVYLGEDAGDAVLGGRIRRGDATTIAAAIWFCDLRGFTKLSNEQPRDVVVATLNDYFDSVAKPVIERGGEILKFIGDAVLAIFPMQTDMDRDRQCRVALDAALSALDGLRDLNELRESGGQEKLQIGIGLHAGSLSYGNIGAVIADRARLDFTVIGPAVNMAARLQSLCGLMEEPLLASRSFASVCGFDLKPLGVQAMRGFAEPQPVFGLPR